MENTIRVALIGKTGCGKSALGNTILCRDAFRSEPAGESVTKTCEVADGTSSSGKRIKVVDTPGIMDTAGKEVKEEVTKAIAALSPGPHAFLIVLQPNRATEEEKRVIKELSGLFGDEGFLEHAIIVMTRKADIVSNDFNIHSFIENRCAKDIQELYKKCGKRIVAVENKHATDSEKRQYTEDVLNAVAELGTFYSHAYFQLLQKNNILEKETAKLKGEIERMTKEREEEFCTML